MTAPLIHTHTHTPSETGARREWRRRHSAPVGFVVLIAKATVKIRESFGVAVVLYCAACVLDSAVVKIDIQLVVRPRYLKPKLSLSLKKKKQKDSTPKNKEIKLDERSIYIIYNA